MYSYRFTLAIDVHTKKRKKERNTNQTMKHTNAQTDRQCVRIYRADFLLTKTDYWNVFVNNYGITFANHYNEYGWMFDFQLEKSIDKLLALMWLVAAFTCPLANSTIAFPKEFNLFQQ